MKKLTFTLCYCLLLHVGFAQNAKEISGIISDDFGPIANVVVTLTGKDTRVSSDANGRYQVRAVEGDILDFNIMGKIPLQIRVEDVTRILNVSLFDKVTKLEEVTVAKKRLNTMEQRAKEYSTNPNIIKNSFGYLDKETVGYSLRILDEKDIGSKYMDIGSLLNGRFAGVVGRCNFYTGEVEVFLRGELATFDVDGLVMNTLPCQLIDPSNIKRIGVIAGLAGTVLYGTTARAGVVIINTKTGTLAPLAENNYQKAKDERNKHNLYNGDALSITDSQGQPSYMEAYSEANSVSEAIAIYEKELEKYAASYFFMLDSYSYFKKNWENDEFTEQIIAENWGVFENNPVALKSLAYVYQSNNDYVKAKKIYKEVFILRPEYAQSYYNLADSYTENREFARAATMYTRYDYLKDVGFLNDDQGDFAKFMNTEFTNLLGLKENDFLSAKNSRKLASKNDFTGTRLVFEWADSEAEFELQFVNPENRYFKWNHTLKDNSERIRDEKSLGYSTEEYLIGNNYKGDWQVNITYFGNKSLSPTYVKAIIYHDYGTPMQRKETKVFKLSLRNVNQQLFSVANAANVVSN